MTLQSRLELQVSRQKLTDLEQLYAQTLATPEENGYPRELTLRSLRRTINQLKEEIARFEARSGSTAKSE